MLIAHVSDSHLGYRQYGLLEREKDLYSCFEEAIGKALEDHVDVVVHSGDLFHYPSPPPQAYRSAIRALKKLKHRGIPFLCVMGQHDRPKVQALPPLTVLEDMDLLIHISPDKPYVSGDFSAVGLDYMKKQTIKEKLQKVKALTKRSVLVAHVLVKEVSPFGDVSIHELPRGFSYYALGDYHIFKKFKVHEFMATYSGSTEVISLNDVTSEGKGFCIVDLSRDDVEVHFVKLEGVRPRLIEHVEFEKVKEEVSKIISRALAMNIKPIIHLFVKNVGAKRSELSKIREELSKVSLKTEITVEEEVAQLVSSTRTSFSGVEDAIKSLGLNIGNLVLEIYRAFKSGDLHNELERVLKSGEWINWTEQTKIEVQPIKPLGPADMMRKTKSTTLLGWMKRDSREA